MATEIQRRLAGWQHQGRNELEVTRNEARAANNWSCESAGVRALEGPLPAAA